MRTFLVKIGEYDDTMYFIVKGADSVEDAVDRVLDSRGTRAEVYRRFDNPRGEEIKIKKGVNTL